MDNAAYIEDYFTGSPNPEQIRIFEQRVQTDPAFAEEVAFYLSVHTVAGEIAQSRKKQQFREIYQKHLFTNASPVKKTSGNPPVRKLVYYISVAAIVAGICFGIYVYQRPVNPQELAIRYEENYLKSLPVTLGNHSDSIQSGLQLFNAGKIAEAQIVFEQIIQSDTNNFTAQKYAGLISLRLKEYDRALTYFKQLETHTELFANPALFYQALTLMERNQSGDLAKAKQYLRLIVQHDLEGKETAEKWLRKM